MDEENQNPDPAENSPQPQKASMISPTVLAVIAAVVVIALAIFLISRNKQTTNQQTGLENQPETEQISQTESSPTSRNTETSQVADQSQTIKVEGGAFYFKPNEIKVKKGQKVTIEFTNVKGTHNFVIDELDVSIPTINAGQSEKVEFTPETAGSFKFYCSVGNHRAMGMEGTLIVE